MALASRDEPLPKAWFARCISNEAQLACSRKQQRLVGQEVQMKPIGFIVATCAAWSLTNAVAATPISSSIEGGGEGVEDRRPSIGDAHQPAVEAARGDKGESDRVRFIDGQRFIDKALENPIQRPCREGEENRSSELCAQWQSAQGARESALWAWWNLILTGISIILLVVTLIYVHLGTRLAAKAVLAAEQAVHSARDAVEVARHANEEAVRANGIAADAFHLQKLNFEEQMRPRCVVIGVTVAEGWADSAKAGSPVLIMIQIENLGGSTGRNLSLYVENIAFLNHDGSEVWRGDLILPLAPLRRGQVREERLKIEHSAFGKDIHRIELRGRIGASNDAIKGGANLHQIEHFAWGDNALNRSSTSLVERAHEQ